MVDVDRRHGRRRALVGAVYAPALGELFAAARGRGATLDGRPIRCSDRTDVALALVGTGFSYLPERRRQQAALVAEVIGAVRDVRRLGSAALDLCFVAAGRYDAYFETGLNSWDAAAGELIAREAGCRSGNFTRRCRPAVGAARLDTGDLRGDGRAAPPLPRGDLTGPARLQPERPCHRASWSPVGTKILAVEDDERIREAVKLALEDEGWTVEGAGSGEEAVDLFAQHVPDVVLIDIMLPGIDGFELCRTLRRSSDVPIVMVTARNDTHDVVAGLEAGADDYLTKPFAPKELSARIRALLRRVRPVAPGHERLVFGDLELIPEEGKVLRGGGEVHLTKTEFRLLCELAENRSKVFSREELLDKVWGYDYFGDGRLVDVHIRRLRTKVEADPAAPRHVVTVRGLGYRLE